MFPCVFIIPHLKQSQKYSLCVLHANNPPSIYLNQLQVAPVACPDGSVVVNPSDKRPYSSSGYDSDGGDDPAHQACGSPTKSELIKNYRVIAFWNKLSECVFE